MKDIEKLIEKYAVAGPRYTSYPTALSFSESADKERLAELAASRDAVAEVVLDTDDEKAPLLAMLNADVRFEELAPQAGENARFAVYLSDEPVLVAVWTRPRLKAHRTRPDPWQHPLESMGEISSALLSVLLVHRADSERLD